MWQHSPRISNISKASSGYEYFRDSGLLQLSLLQSALKSAHHPQHIDPSQQRLRAHRLQTQPSSRLDPYFSQKLQEEIFCVICNKFYRDSQLEAHLLMHKKPKVPATQVNPTPKKDITFSTFSPKPNPLPKRSANVEIPRLNFSSSLFSTPKVTARETIPSLSPIQRYSIAPSIPFTQRMVPPKKTNIFKPSHLGVTPQYQPSYQQQYLDSRKYSLYNTRGSIFFNDNPQSNSFRASASQKMSFGNKSSSQHSCPKHQAAYQMCDTSSSSVKQNKMSFRPVRERQREVQISSQRRYYI